MSNPTPEELRREIERGPLAAELAEFWANVSRRPAGAEVGEGYELLDPIAANYIWQVLAERRAAQLGWSDGWDYGLVIEARGGGSPPPLAPLSHTPPEPSPYRPEPDVAIPPDTPPYFVGLERIKRELADQSDRGAAVLAGAFVDEVLTRALKMVLRDAKTSEGGTIFRTLFNWHGGLGAFSARIALAFAIRFIGEHTRHDLDIIRDIRNDFSHDLDIGSPDKGLTFRSPSVIARCSNLWLPANDYFARIGSHWLRDAHLDHARGRYVFAVFKAAGLIDNTAELWKLSGQTQPSQYSGLL